MKNENMIVISDAELEGIVNETYGSDDEGYVFEAAEEAGEGESYTFGPLKKGVEVDYEVFEYTEYTDWRGVIRNNKCPMFVTHEIMQDLVNLGKLPEGTFLVECI